MVNQLIQGMIAIVIGLALLPVIAGFVEELTGTDGAFEEGPVSALIELLPVLYVIVLIVGVVGFIYTSKR